MQTTLLLLLVAQKFFVDDPIRQDHDTLPIDAPGEIELSSTYDMLANTFAGPELEDPIPRASNINTIGEVPDSSWFTNRIGSREMSLRELRQGPGANGPPDTSRRLTIIAAKQGGITPGFTIRDANGRVYYVKFDPKAHPSLSTAADVISKNFFHAIGYNVPEAYIVFVRAEHFEIDAGAVLNLPGGNSVPMDREYLEFMLASAARVPDGNVRAVASHAIPGDAIGPFQFFGTRSDDPNDLFSHQHRRELRAYRVFCAWLNHDDSRAINTLDTFVDGHVKHYLIDFGSTLGSGSDVLRNIAPQDPRAGNEYMIDLHHAWRAAYSFGILDRPWRNIDYPYPEFAEVGRIESAYFRPEDWKPEYPNPAFDRMRADDAFWAAKIVARFSDEGIREIVKTGDFLSAGAEAYLAETIMRRRDKIVDYYFRQLSPLDRFRVEATRLEFDALASYAGDVYAFEWFSFDNERDARTSLSIQGEASESTIAIPPTAEPFLVVRIRTRSETVPAWNKAVDVFLRRSPRGYEVVGVEREI